MFEVFFPILFLFVLAVVIALIMSGLSVFIGKRTKLGKKDVPYECGVEPVGNTKEPVPLKFYLVSILFILFDIEVIFLFPWAVISDRLGMFGFIEMVVFVVILLVGYFYILKRGALEWD